MVVDHPGSKLCSRDRFTASGRRARLPLGEPDRLGLVQAAIHGGMNRVADEAADGQAGIEGCAMQLVLTSRSI
jgi:hypothetical protein